MTNTRTPLTGLGLKLFRVWLYAPFPVAFLTLAVLILSSPHIDRIGLGAVFAFVLCAYASFCWTRRVERKLGHENLFVSTTAWAFVITTLACVLYTVLRFVLHQRLHPNVSQPNYEFPLIIFNAIVPPILMRMDWNNRRLNQ